MKVLFIHRNNLHIVPGGDSVQILKTAESLRRLGISVDTHASGDLLNYSSYDLLHFFNITRPADILIHIKRSKKPYVLSPIFVDYSEYDRKIRRGLSGWVLKLFSANGIEYIKTLARFILKGDNIPSWQYLVKGQQKSIEQILRNCSGLLPNSQSELHRLGKYFNITPANYAIIPNAIDPLLFNRTEIKIKKENNLVICAARIEGIKNQVNLIKALNHTHYKLVLIGAPAPNQLSYYKKCQKLAAPNIIFAGRMKQSDLLDFYKRARVHVLPSWFETTGLSSLEAAAMGCSIVITDKGDTREYFGEAACYCDPGDPLSILAAIDKAAGLVPSEAFIQKILAQYTWEKAGEKTRDFYLTILSPAR